MLKRYKNKFTIYHSLFTVFCLLLTLFIPAVAFSEVVGKITSVEGRVDILRAGATASVPVMLGDSVSVGDILRTKSDGKAEITFIDDSVMAVGPKSRLGIDEYLFNSDEERREASLKLYRGRTGFKVPKPVYPAEGSKFEMKTRTAVAGVRGTEGILYTDGVERVYVKDGVMDFSNPLGTVIVSDGEVGEIFYEQVPTERPFSENEYQQQEQQVSPGEPGAEGEAPKTEGEAPPPAEAEAPPPPPPPPVTPAIVEGPILPPPIIIPPSPFKSFSVSASILDGTIEWYNSSEGDNTAADILSGGSISGSFNQTVIEGGYYNLNMSGSYAWSASNSVAPSFASTDDWFAFLYSGSTSEGDPFYGAGVGDICVSCSWSGGNIGWIEDGSKRYWYIGELDGSYSTVFYNNNSGSRAGPPPWSGTFSASVDGLFWDGAKPFWEQFQKINQSLPESLDFFVPITDTALRTFDISINPGQSLALKDANGIQQGSVSITSGVAGKGIEISQGSGLFDMNVNGSWSASTAITNLTEISGSISGLADTSFTMLVDGGVEAINSNTAIVGAEVGPTFGDPSGVMIGKMTGSTSGTFEGKAIGEMKSGFMLP